MIENVADRAMPRVGDVVAGKYRIEEVIGEGGMGAVFAAIHALTGKRVAIKWMRPELAADQAAVQRFVREAQAAGRIDHPNVVDVYDVGEHEGSTFLVMEYLYGETLTSAFTRGGLDAGQIIQLLLPAMRGVAAANRTGVVHRDLKPDNIFLCRGADNSYREPKVLDFGISKVSTTDQQVNPRLTRTGAVMGTPYYMSPEQIRGSSEVDQRTDVYAFGVILYEALTGRVPFDADAYSALILEIATGTPKRPRELKPDLPQRLEDVVMRAMAREPDQRYQDVESLARALEPFAKGVTFHVDRADPTGARQRASTTPFTSLAAPPAPVRHTRLVWIVGVSMALIGLGFWFARSGGNTATADHLVKPAVIAAPAQPSAKPPEPQATTLPKGLQPPPVSVDAGVLAREAGPGVVERPARESGDRAADPAGVRAPAVAEPGEVIRHRARHRAESETREPSASPRRAPTSTGRTGTLRSDEF